MSQATHARPQPDAAVIAEATQPRSLAVEVVRLLRPKQWSKNLLVFAAYIFTGSFRDPAATKLVLIAFAALCLASSFIYVLNDVLDVKRDRLHPRKRFRPIASGAISAHVAMTIGLLALFACAVLATLLDRTSMAVLAAYVLLQVLYNFGLKRVAIADVFLISVGFILRAALGAAAISVTISSWLLFCTGALALMLGFSKRRSEYILLGDCRGDVRESLAAYSRPALDALVVMFAAGAALCYGIYSVQSPTAHKYPALILTSVFVVYGICRYVLIVFGRDEGGEPETLLYRDPHVLFSLVMFVATAVLAMSGFKVPLLE